MKLDKNELNDFFRKSYLDYFTHVEKHIDEEGWVYVKEVIHLLDVYFEGNTGKKIEYQKSFGRSGDNPHWMTRGARWRPQEISDYFINTK